MTRYLPLFLLLAFTAGCATATAGGPKEQCCGVGETQGAGKTIRSERIRSVLPQNVRVVVTVDGQPARSASGVVLGSAIESEGPTTYVVTNAHVVAPRGNEVPGFVVLVDAPTGDTHEFGARVVAQGKVPDMDLAVLAVPGISLEAVSLAGDAEVGVGEDVFVVAAPYGRSLSVSGGMVSQVDLERQSPHLPAMLKTDAAIGYGASGGGMFSASSGKLVGIVEGYRTAKVTIPVATETYSFDVPMPGETFAAPTAKIRKFLEEKGLTRILPTAKASAPVVHVG